MAGGKANNPAQAQVDEAIVKAGGFGRFQWYTCIVVIVGMMAGGFITHGIAYLELEPHEGVGYICKEPGVTYTKGEPNVVCLKEPYDTTFCGEYCVPKHEEDGEGNILFATYPTWCDGDTGSRREETEGGFQFTVAFGDDDEHQENLYNWYTKIDLACKPKRTTSLIGMMAFVGVFMGCLFIPRFGDLYGRRPIFLVCMVVQSPLILCCALFKDVKGIFALTLFFGMCLIGRMACGFLLLLELMPGKNQAAVGGAMMVAEGMVAVIWTVYFKFISKDAFPFLIFAGSLAGVCALLCFVLPESPRYLFGTEDFDKCREVLAYIARFNGVKNWEDPHFDAEDNIFIETEDLDDPLSPQSPSGTGKQVEDPKFDHLLDDKRQTTKSPNDNRTMKQTEKDRKSRYQTTARQTQALTKRESVAQLHENIAGVGLRSTAHLFVIGADRTQSIALDEIFGKKPRDTTGQIRATKTYRKTRVTNVESIKEEEEAEIRPSLNTEVLKKKAEENALVKNATDEAEEIVELPTRVVQGGLCAPDIRWNLILMVWMWIATSVNYMIINFYMKYVPGSEFLNFAVAGVAEIFGHIVCGAFFKQLTPRWTFFIGYVFATAGGIALLWQGKFEEQPLLISGLVLAAKFGQSLALCTCYVATPFLFPTKLAGTAFGICNMFGRFFSIAAPAIAELLPPLPMRIFGIFNIISLVACLMISVKKE